MKLKNYIRFSKQYLLVPAVIVLFVYLLVAATYVNRVLPNTYLGSINVGGKANEAATGVISEGIDGFWDSSVVFMADGHKVKIPVRELGITYDKQTTVNNTIKAKWAAGFFPKALSLPASFFSRRTISLRYGIDFSVLNANLRQKLSGFEKPPMDASVGFGTNEKVKAGRDGSLVDYGSLLQELSLRVENLDPKPIEVNFTATKPKIEAKALTRAVDKYQKLTTSKIVFDHGYDSWSLAGDELVGILKFEVPGQEGGYVTSAHLGSRIVLSNLLIADSAEKPVEIVVDESKINNFLDEIATQVDRPTVNATLKFEGGKVTEFNPAVDGQKLDLQAAKSAVAKKISIESIGNDEVITLKLPVIVTTAAVANEQINNLGIRELVGRGVSYFAGSIPNRMFNVELGSSRINGTLVAPGDTFSFNKSVGEVNGATGYKQAYVISAGKTVLDDGGGICQVSTTVFRAALNAGLPIVSRTGHAYRVGYYEQNGFGPGLDATVWSPSVDFVFKNDTTHHILVQTIFDPYQSRLEVDLYGTRDGRVAEISTPVVSNVTPAPPEKREDDPSLPKGTVKQVDFAAAGASTYFTRKVYRGDKLVSDDIFRTNFRPWQAVYLVGTGG